MPDYRRAKIPGATYFFTVVTFNRRPFLATEPAISCLRAVIRRIKAKRPFSLDAFCILPDHIHCIWTLPLNDADYSTRWNLIKGMFTKNFRKTTGLNSPDAWSRYKKRERPVWQKRFWEHWLRDRDDLNRHLDYLHFNPVKHALAHKPGDWPWSSFAHYLAKGWYDSDWGRQEPGTIREIKTAKE